MPAASPRWRDLTQERVAVEGPVERTACPGEQRQQPPGHVASSRLLPTRAPRRSGRGCRSRPAPSAAASDTRQSPSGTGSARTSRGCGRFGDLERVAAVEGDRAQPAEPHPRRARLGQRAGDHLEQRLQRRRAEPAAQVPQRFLRRGRHGTSPPARRSAWPRPARTQPREHPQRQQKYTPTRDGRSRSRRCTVLVCSRTSSTNSNGRYCVNSPRWPGANIPAATVTARVT